MTDKEYNAWRKLVIKLYWRWKHRLGLTSWAISLDLFREKDEDAPTCYGRMQSKWEYKAGTMSLYAPTFKGKDEKFIESIIIHEFCHVLVCEMRDWNRRDLDQSELAVSMKHEERVVTQMTDAFLWTYGDGVKEGKKAVK